jgi:intracellular multiplication protein IcmO
MVLLHKMLSQAEACNHQDGICCATFSDGAKALLCRDISWSLGDSAEVQPACDNALGGNNVTVVFNRHVIRGRTSDGTTPQKHLRLLPLRDIGEEAGQAVEAACIHVDDPQHLFITNDYIPTHNTESLMGFCANALSWGSGFLFCDGKGDVSVFAKVYALARRFGREDDLLVINFMTDGDDSGPSRTIKSNTLNPFSTGNSDDLTQMVASLMDEVGGDGAMWKGRATAMLTGVIRALCWLRDSGYVDLNVGVLRDHLTLPKVMELANEKKYPDMPHHIRSSIRAYLLALPGFQEEKGEKQPQTALDQHGFLQMQFSKITGSLADVYGHIFGTSYGEVDMFDVVLNRRLLFIMLPSLGKSGDEIANLGKIVVANLKSMMASTLGSEIEGRYDEIIKNRPSDGPSPFFTILDEVGYYTVDGMALIAAQVRSLGFSMVYASQDIPAMKRRSEKEALSIIANTNTKIFMRIEDPGETGKLAIERGDKALRARVNRFEKRSGELAGKHAIEGDDVVLDEGNRISLRDLVSQSEGEMHVIRKDSIVRARSFYANPEGSIDMSRALLRANHFISVPRPNQNEIDLLLPRADIMAYLCDPATPQRARSHAMAPVEANKDSEPYLMKAAIDAAMVRGEALLDAACAGICAVVSAADELVSEFNDKVTRATMRQHAAEMHEMHGTRGAHEEDADIDDDAFDDEDDRIFDNPSDIYQDFETRHRRIDPTVPHGARIGDRFVDMSTHQTSADSFARNIAALNQEPDAAMQKRMKENLYSPTMTSPPAKTENTSKDVKQFAELIESIGVATEMVAKHPNEIEKYSLEANPQKEKSQLPGDISAQQTTGAPERPAEPRLAEAAQTAASETKTPSPSQRFSVPPGAMGPEGELVVAFFSRLISDAEENDEDANE